MSYFLKFIIFLTILTNSHDVLSSSKAALGDVAPPKTMGSPAAPPSTFSSCSLADNMGEEPKTEHEKLDRLRGIIHTNTGSEYPLNIQAQMKENDPNLHLDEDTVEFLRRTSVLVYGTVFEAYEKATDPFKKTLESVDAYDKEVKRLSEGQEKAQLARLKAFKKIRDMRLKTHADRIVCTLGHHGWYVNEEGTEKLVESIISTLQSHLKYFLYTQQESEDIITATKRKIDSIPQQILQDRAEKDKKGKEAKKDAASATEKDKKDKGDKALSASASSDQPHGANTSNTNTEGNK